MLKSVLIFIVSVVLVHGMISEDYMDDIVKQMLYDDGVELDDSREYENGDDHLPVFDNGQWKCGNCNELDSLSLLHAEENEFDTNYSKNFPTQLQVAVSIDNMQCVTVDTPNSSAEHLSSVRKVSGFCVGDTVTLAVTVHSATAFTVRVYGNDEK